MTRLIKSKTFASRLTHETKICGASATVKVIGLYDTYSNNELCVEVTFNEPPMFGRYANLMSYRWRQQSPQTLGKALHADIKRVYSIPQEVSMYLKHLKINNTYVNKLKIVKAYDVKKES